MIKKITTISLLFLLSAPSFAADEHDHGSHQKKDQQFYGHLDIKVHADRIVSAEDADEKFDEYYSHSHLELGMRVNSKISINSNIKIEGEPAGHAHGHGEGKGSETSNGNKIFAKHPLLVEQLTINFENENYSIYAGKFNPSVGFDYHNFPSIFGYQVIESYLIRERIGLGAKFRQDAGDLGQHTLNFSSFFADTTALSNSILFQRGTTSKKDGGLSNTEDFRSYSISLNGSDFYSLDNNIVEGLSYGLGYAKQAAGIGNDADEDRFSRSLGYQFKLNEDIKSKFIVESMAINQLGGEAAHDRNYTTVGLGFDYQNWNFGASYTHINNDADEEDESYDGHIRQISAGYSFSNGLDFTIGYKTSDQDNEKSARLGILFARSYDF